MAKQENQKKSVISYLGSTYVNSLIFLGISILTFIGLIITLLVTSNSLASKIVAGALGFVLVVLVILVIILSVRFVKAFYRSFLPVMSHNLEQIADNKKDLKLIKNDEYIEYERLNMLFRNLQERYDSQSFIDKQCDYSNIYLDYVDYNRGVVSYDSLMKNIPQLVLASKTYMNALISIRYDVNDKINLKTFKKNLELVLSYIDYPYRLLAAHLDHKGFNIYVPCFDSIHQLEEELENAIKNIAIMAKSPVGKKLTLPKATMVVYPYSEIEELTTDLEKASHTSKLINVYLPQKSTKRNVEMLQETRNINRINYLLEQASSFDPRPEFLESNIRKLRHLMSLFSDYYSFSGCGFIKYDDVKKEFVVDYSYGEDFFPNGEIIEKSFVEALNEHKDSNKSYYFSNKSHANNDIKSFLDYYLISSGSFYVVETFGRTIGLIYFLNKDKEIFYDSYLKESLLSFSTIIGKYIVEVISYFQSQISEKKFSDVIKFSSIMLYSIDKEDYSIVYASDALKKVKKLDLKQKCYKALYGLDEPCENCPILTLKHMHSSIAKLSFDASLAFKNASDKEAHIYLKQVNKNEEPLDMYDQEFLVPKYNVFLNTLSNSFETGERGYTGYLIISNVSDIVSEHGNEGYSDYIRKYIKEMEDEGVELYLIKHNTFGIIFPEVEEKDFTKKLSTLHKIATKLGIAVCYIGKSYPANATDAVEYMKDINKLILGYKVKEKVNSIYIIDSGYTRLADEDEYIVNLTEKAVKDGELGLLFTPVLNNSDRLIHGVEVNPVFKDRTTLEVIDSSTALSVLKSANKMDMLTDGYLISIDKLLEKYGYGFFLSHGISKLTIHTDHSYFGSNLLSNLGEISKKHQFEKGFICFEVSEEDVHANQAQYSQYIKDLKSYGGSISVNEYNGKLVSPETLSSLGFDNVKISSVLSSGVNGSQDVLDTVLDLWKHIHKCKMKVSFEGIINREQADLIHLDNVDCRVQGNYFFNADGIEKFIARVKERNRKDEDFNT